MELKHQTANARPELLAPAGNREMMHAAIENGADAIYFGLEEFNARLRAGNFATSELAEIFGWLHERGVKGYVCLNTLVFSAELDDAARLLLACNKAGADAVLVQDLGVAALAARLVPEMSIHASTQMTLTAPESVAATRKLGIHPTRVIVARETTLKELEKYQKATDVELEIFVHGALCVAYSGQCLTSEALGGRSANRGECAQACRLPYELIVDGKPFDTGDARYPLSPKDLAAYEEVGELIRNGISALKIEGRLKTPEYVAATVQSYRKAIDDAFSTPDRPLTMDAETRAKLEMTFSRGFTAGYLPGIDHQEVVDARFPKKRGTYLGRVSAVERESVTVDLQSPLKPGDGIVFDAGHPEQDEQGGRVYNVKPRGKKSVQVDFGRGAVDFRMIHVGDRVWKTSDPQIDRELAASFAGDQVRFRRPVRAKLTAAVGKSAVLELEDESGNRATAVDTLSAEAATNRPLTADAAEKQLCRTGGTPFEVVSFEADISGDLMIPFSRLNELRRDAVQKLIAARREMHRGRRSRAEALSEMRRESATVNGLGTVLEQPEMNVLCRSLEQVEAAIAHAAAANIYVDFENLRELREARSAVKASGKQFIPATLRILKPGEAGFVAKLLELAPDAVLVRSLGAYAILRDAHPELPLHGDYSLNVANELTAALLMRGGIRQITPSYDLNIDQLLDLLRAVPPHWFEVTMHQHLPMFHMEHCVFCRFLSDGTDYTNCGRPCESHSLELLDRKGYRHPVKADAACRNTVYNAVAQSASEYITMLRNAGILRWRVELLSESAAQVRETLDLYSRAIAGETGGSTVWKRLRATAKLGVTRGSLDRE